MADTKISALPAATTPLAGTEVLPIVQSGATDKVSVANLTAGRDIATKQITSTVSGLTTALDGWSLTNGSANALFKLSGATYGYRGIGSNYVWIGGDGSPMYVGTSTAQPVRMGTNAFQQLTLETSGDVTVNTNNLVIGTSGKGIDFSANPNPAGMTSELLNDYEEGTWTPALLFDSGMVGSFTYTTQVGTYTKVGRLVTARFNLAWSARPSAGLILVLNLPFTAVNAANVQGFISAQGGITNIGTYTIIAGDGLVVTSYVASECAISTVKSGGAFTDPLQQTALTSASGSLAGEIIYEVS